MRLRALGFVPWLAIGCAVVPGCACGDAFTTKGRGGEGSSDGWNGGTNGTAASAGDSGGSGWEGGASGDAGAAGNGGAAAAAGNGGVAGGFGGAGGAGGGGNTGPVGEKYIVYASTDKTLFALDPTDPELPLIEVGDFDCTADNGPYTSMVDIAVDRFEKVWGITGHAVMPLVIGPDQVLCGEAVTLTSAQPGQQIPTFYGLTFAPIGVLDPVKEVLVAGNTAGELWSVDAAGNIELRGDFGLVPPDDGNGHTYNEANVGKPWELSGDIVFLANDGEPVGFATVRDCPYPPSPSDCNKNDTLLELDLAKLKLPDPGNVTKAIRGKILKEPNCGMNGVVSGSMFGIAAWNDSVFGFSRTGKLVRIDTADASGCLIKTYPNYLFSGAGVSTLAPVDVPPLQ